MFRGSWLYFVALFSVQTVYMECKHVVIIPMPFTSHAKYHINVAHELVKIGHQVWLTMPDYLVTEGVLDTSNITVIEYTTIENMQEMPVVLARDIYFKGISAPLKKLLEKNKHHSIALLKNDTFVQEIRDVQPDLIILDNVFLKMLSVIPYRLGVPFAFVGSFYDPVGQRIPFTPTVTPKVLLGYSDHMDFFERVLNVFTFFMSIVNDISVDSDAVATFAPEMPYLPLDMLVARAEIWLVEMDHILDYPKPTVPNVKLIGGTATGPAKPLPPEFQAFMDDAKQGVIIVSFGSYVLNLPKHISDKIMQVLLQLPMKAIFRSDLASPDPQKILTSHWIPQNDLLGHPNTKVFVSHCGKNGQYEALYHAVPVVACPMFVDQFYNAERMRVKGFAERADLMTVSADDLLDIIMKVATDRRYKQAISKASEMFRIEFGIPKERAAFWLDHIMKYGGAHMRSAGHQIPYYQFLGLDIAIFLAAVIICIVCVFFCCCCLVARCLRPKKHKKD